MTTERSDKLHDAHRASGEKFDYFVLGATGALVAYISQTYVPAKLGLSPNTLQLIALLLLFLAAFAGFRRIERTVELFGANYSYLRALEERGSLTSSYSRAPLINSATGDVLSPGIVAAKINTLNAVVPKLDAQLNKLTAAALFWYQTRNWLLALGFVALVSSKVWAAYVQA